MAWSKEGSKHYQTREYKSARQFVVNRDGALCFRCEVLFNRPVPFAAVDHFIPLHRMEAIKHDPETMWCLCKSCHDEKTQLESLGKPYPFKPRIDPETGFDYEEDNWLERIKERTNAFNHKRRNRLIGTTQ